MRLVVIAIATIVHLLPHPFGASTVGASAVFAGEKLPLWRAALTPILILLLGNLFFGFYEPLVLAFVYLGFALSAVASHCILAKKHNLPRRSAAVVLGAVLFFLVSNFSIWLVGMYPATAEGLIACYVNGLPYLGMALIADSIYCSLLFTLHSLLTNRHMETVTA